MKKIVGSRYIKATLDYRTFELTKNEYENEREKDMM